MAKKKKDKIKKGKSSRRSSRSTKRRYQKEQLIKRVQDSQKQAEGGGISILKGNVSVPIFKCGDGAHIIDIIPYPTGKNNVEGDKPGKVHYTFHYYIHKNVGPNNDWYICPARTWGDECPICEHRAKLVEKGADYDTKIAPLNTKERNLYNIVSYDKGEERKGVQVWDVSYHYFEKHIVALSKKPSRGGRAEKTVVFFDEEEGKSITFTVEPAKSKEDYPSFVGHSFDDRDYQISDEILDAAHCLDELVHRPTYEELEKAYWGTKSKDDDSDDDDDDNETNWEMLIDDVDDIEDQEELDEFCEEHDIEVKMKKKKFKKNKKAVRAWLEEKSAEDRDDDDDDDDDEVTTDDIEEMDQDELLEYCDDNDLKPPKKVKKKIKKLRAWVLEQLDEDDDDDDDDDDDSDDDDSDDYDDDDDDDDDGEDDDDDDEDEDDDDEEDEDTKSSKRKGKGKSKKEKGKKGKGKAPKYTIDDIEEMNMRKLKKLIKKEGLKINVKKAEDVDDLQDMVIDALGIEDDD